MTKGNNSKRKEKNARPEIVEVKREQNTSSPTVSEMKQLLWACFLKVINA